MGRLVSAVALSVLLASAGGLVVSTEANAACGGLLQPPCPPPPPPAPDPGGTEEDQPVPPPGKRLGFNSALYFTGAAATPADELDRTTPVGASLHRFDIPWRGFQPTPGSPPIPAPTAGNRTDEVDKFYAAALARGITPILIPFNAPLWATRYRECSVIDLVCNDMRSKITQHNLKAVPDFPEFEDEYRTWITAVKSRWPRALIETWNEPNSDFTNPNYQDARQYWASPAHMKQIQCAAYASSKAVNDDPVLAPGWSNQSDSDYMTYMDGVYKAGGASCWDLANMHDYSFPKLSNGEGNWFGEGSAMATLFKNHRALRTKYGDTAPIWVTETGYSVVNGVDEAEQREYMRRHYNKLVSQSDVGAVVVHNLRDNPNPTYITDPQDPEYNFGWLRSDWTPKPVYCHFVLQAGKAYPGC